MDTKGELLARMAVARARVWQALLALPEHTLEHQPVVGDWTPKDTLAHLAYWDAARAEHLALMLGGRAAEIHRANPDPINARVYAQRCAWTLERVAGEAEAARARFLSVLEPLTDADLDRTFTITPDTPVTVRGWVERRAQHDLAHLEPILAWRESSKPKEIPGPWRVLKAALDAGRAAFLTCGDLIPEAERSSRPICGEWTWQDLLGHVADWEFYGIEGLRTMAQGKRFESDPDVEEWNSRHAAARRGESYQKTWEDFIGARQQLLDLLGGYNDARLARPASAAPSFLSHHYFWFSICATHDLEHAEGLESALLSQDA